MKDRSIGINKKYSFFVKYLLSDFFLCSTPNEEFQLLDIPTLS